VEVVQWSKSTSGKIQRGCTSGELTLGFATYLVFFSFCLFFAYFFGSMH